MIGITGLLIKFQVARKMQLVEGELYRDQFRFPATPPLSHHFALSEK